MKGIKNKKNTETRETTKPDEADGGGGNEGQLNGRLVTIWRGQRGNNKVATGVDGVSYRGPLCGFVTSVAQVAPCQS